MMCHYRSRLLKFVLFLAVSWVMPMHAQPGPTDLDPAIRVLRQATSVTPDGRHHQTLRGLRKTSDPELRPLYQHLTSKISPALQTHGILGLAETSPQKTLDLATLSELADARQRVEIIGAALDDDLLSDVQMSTLLSWNDLQQGARQAIAVRLLASGGSVDAALFTPALQGDPAELLPGQLLERGIAAAMLTQLGDPRGIAELEKIASLDPTTENIAVRAQLVTLAVRHDFQRLGGWTLMQATDEELPMPLREVAMRSALRLDVDGGEQAWASMYREADGLAGRLKLTLIALSAAGSREPGMFREADSNGSQLIQKMLDAGQAAASQPPIDLQPIQALVDEGYHLGTRWMVDYAENEAGDQAPAILQSVIRGYDKGHDSGRNALMATAIEAAASLSELPGQAGHDALLTLIREPGNETLRQIVYSGLIRSDSNELQPLVQSLPEPIDEISRDVFLVLRLRNGLELSAEQWQRIATLVERPGLTDGGIRSELAWHQVKRAGQVRPVLDRLIRE